MDRKSIYKIDTKSGKIIEHRVENMIINDKPVTLPYSVLTMLRDELLYPTGRRAPVGVGVGAMCES